MNAVGRLVMFLALVLLSWSLMHVFVLTRLWSLPFLSTPAARRWLIAAFVFPWISFPLAQVLARSAGRAALPLEVFASIWLGVLFLLFVWLLAADLLTGFGWLLPHAVPLARTVASVATVLASVIGLYGAIAFFVARRTREIGIRIALGARPVDVVADVVKQGGRLAAAGSVIGLVCAALVGQLMRDSLYGVSAADPIVFAGVTLVVGLVALAAAYLPARRAARTDPIVALRCE